MSDTLNDRAFERPLEVVIDKTHVEEHKERNENEWMEVRLQGKLPERRSNHCAFVVHNGNQEYLYVHGGRDLKEGAHSSMWRVCISGILNLRQDPYHPVEWECVNTHGAGLGRISHHTASVRNSNEVVFYGGLKGEESNKLICLFNCSTNTWNEV